MDKIGNKVIVVTGLMRSGTSAIMQCLSAAGINCLGSSPGYEDPRTVEEGIMPTDLMLDAQGGAIKILEPHCRFLPAGFEYIVIATDRSKDDQAKSYLKFIKQLGASTTMNDKMALRRLKRMLIDHQRQAARVLNLMNCPLFRVSFEDLMKAPKVALKPIADELDLDLDKMASSIIDRSPKCAKDMKIELGYINGFKRSGEPPIRALA